MDLQIWILHTNKSAQLSQSVEHATLNLRVMGSGPTLGGTCFWASPVAQSV